MNNGKNVGRIIQDFFCNGFADREYDMSGAVIIAEGEGWIVCKKKNGKNVFIDFQIFDWWRDEKGTPLTIKDLSIRENAQQYIDDWVNDTNSKSYE